MSQFGHTEPLSFKFFDLGGFDFGWISVIISGVLLQSQFKLT